MNLEYFVTIFVLLSRFGQQIGAFQYFSDAEGEQLPAEVRSAFGHGDHGPSAVGAGFDEAAIVRTQDGRTNVRIERNMDAETIARLICEGHTSDHGKAFDDSCLDLSAQAIRKQQFELYGLNADVWAHNSVCGCMLPTSKQRKPALQYLHVPKAGTSVNWFLRDYFGGACASEQLHNTSRDRGSSQLEDNPCPEWLHTSDLMERGLCGGRLFSCQGHRVRPDLPSQVISRSNTYLLTFLRRPWERALSDFNHFLTNPTSQHLSPYVQAKDIIHGNFTSYLMHPGVANCATKMLTGRQCGEPVELRDADLQLAKRVLSKMLFFGITEHFRESLCLFSFMYGGRVESRHLRGYRRGNYSDLFYSRLGIRGDGGGAISIAEADALSSDVELDAFRRTYRFDIELYDFASELFKDRYSLSGCS